MKPILLITLLCATVLLVGCGAQPKRPDAFMSAGGPEILLPGGSRDEARLLAMGMARSKGWTILESQGDRLVLQRQLPANAPQARLLSAEDAALAPPALEVTTGFVERNTGVLTNLQAFIVTNPGTEAERRLDYTDEYQDELLISLNALASAWLENRERIASEIPIPPDPDSLVETAETAEADNTGDALQAEPWDAEPLADTAVAEQPDTPGAERYWPDEASDQRISAWADAGPDPIEADLSPIRVADSPATPTDPSPSAPPLATSARSSVDTRTITTAAAGPSPPPLFEPDTTPAEPNSMLALNEQAFSGSWGAYAIESASQRGCAVGGRGAVLLNESDGGELHEVQCDNGPNLLLRCQGGICREGN